MGRQVAGLEEELGVVLFERVGNTLELTPAGTELLEHVRAMGDAATRASLAATGQSADIEGTVSITASELIAAYLLPPVVARVRAAHPSIEVEVVASNELRDLQRREADIAIRNATPTQPDLFARKLGVRRARMYATPDYLQGLGELKGPADLARAEFIAFDRTDRYRDHLANLGIVTTRSNFPILTANHLVQWQLARQGLGICMVMEEVGDPDPRVVRVLNGEPSVPVPMWLTSHRELRTSRRTRVVFDLLAEALG